MPNKLTLLQDLEVLPKYVAHEGRCARHEGLAAHGADVFALRARKLLQRDAL